MKPFAELSYSGQMKPLKRLAQSALLKYNLGESRLVCLSHGENTTFKVEKEPNLTNFWYVLRIYRPGKHDIAAIHSELLWLLSLRNNTVEVSKTVAASDGSQIVTAEAVGVPEARYCTLSDWLPGRFLNLGLNAKAVERMGIFLAHLHQHNQQFIPPLGFVRPRFDEEGLLGTPIIPIECK